MFHNYTASREGGFVMSDQRQPRARSRPAGLSGGHELLLFVAIFTSEGTVCTTDPRGIRRAQATGSACDAVSIYFKRVRIQLLSGRHLRQFPAFSLLRHCETYRNIDDQSDDKAISSS